MNHSCPFINNCVGKNNYRYFFAYITCLTICIIQLFIIIGVAWKASTSIVQTCFYIVALLYYGILTILVFNLWTFHLLATLRNLTTNEIVNGRRYAYLVAADGTYSNPYDQGMWANVRKRLTKPSSGQERLVSII